MLITHGTARKAWAGIKVKERRQERAKGKAKLRTTAAAAINAASNFGNDAINRRL